MQSRVALKPQLQALLHAGVRWGPGPVRVQVRFHSLRASSCKQCSFRKTLKKMHDMYIRFQVGTEVQGGLLSVLIRLAKMHESHCMWNSVQGGLLRSTEYASEWVQGNFLQSAGIVPNNQIRPTPGLCLLQGGLLLKSCLESPLKKSSQVVVWDLGQGWGTCGQVSLGVARCRGSNLSVIV